MKAGRFPSPCCSACRSAFSARSWRVWLVGLENNVYVQIGIVALMGLAAKNAILIVEFAKEEHEKKGMGLLDAAMEGAKLRFRPIMMTAFAFILGVVPLVDCQRRGRRGPRQHRHRGIRRHDRWPRRSACSSSRCFTCIVQSSRVPRRRQHEERSRAILTWLARPLPQGGHD